MARRGGSRRTYVRDARGRFASTPGGDARKAAQSQSGKKGTLASRSSLKRSQSKLAAKDKADQSLQGTLSRRAQKGAVTRGNKALKAAKKESTKALAIGGRKGTVGKPKGLKPGALAERRAKKATADNAGRITSQGGDGATVRGGRLKTATGIDGSAGLTGRKKQLMQAAKKRRLQADKIDAKVKALEKEYRSKDSAFYAQGVKPAGRDKMIAKMQKAVQLRDEAAALRLKADNAESMASRKKGTAAAIRQARRNAFDAKGYKVGDTIVTSQNGVQRITKISKNSVRFDKGSMQDKAFLAMYLGL